MYENQALMFLYCISPVHPGAGTALGVIDSPIQRERHTGHPSMAGAGIKGALRDFCRGDQPNEDETLKEVFGPPPGKSSDFAGAISFADAQVVLFPVRSPKSSYYYVTCPTALGRLQRLCLLSGCIESQGWEIPLPGAEEFVSLDGSIKENEVILETFELKCQKGHECLEMIDWIADHAIPKAGLVFFHEKIKNDTLVVNDQVFNHFVQNATLVEPHVRIDDASGTAQDGALFYVENIPPETLMVSLAMASRSRKESTTTSAQKVMEYVSRKIEGKLVQVGGDATTGRGQILIHLVEQQGGE